jgi:hypothetical protein
VAQSVPLKELEDDGFFPPDELNMGDPFVARESSQHDALGISKHVTKDVDFDPRPVGMSTEVAMLFNREIKNMVRDKASLGARFGLTIFLSTLIGIIFLNVGETDADKQVVSSQNFRLKYTPHLIVLHDLPWLTHHCTSCFSFFPLQNLQSHFGAIIMVLLMGMFGTAQPALLAFPEERPVFLREYSTNHYNVLSYFLARFTMEAFITGLQVMTQVHTIICSVFLIHFPHC